MNTATKQKPRHLFENNQRNSTYIFKSGKVANFIGGKYVTDIPEEIAELNEEIKLGHPNLSVDSSQVTVDETYGDAIAALKKKWLAELRESEAAALDSTRSSTSESGKLEGIGNSATVAALTSGSTSLDAPVVSGTAKITVGPKA